MSIFKKLFNKKQSVQSEPKEPYQIEFNQGSAYSIAKRYILVNPKLVLGDKVLWSAHKTMSIAYEDGNETKGVQMDTAVMLPFFMACKFAPSAWVEPEYARTVSVVRVDKDAEIYVVPTLPSEHLKKPCHLYWVDSQNKTINRDMPQGWFNRTTPDVRKALAAEIRVHFAR